MEIKISGTKATIKRPAPQSPANIRHIDSKGLRNGRHTHAKLPPSLLRNVLAAISEDWREE